MRAWPPSRDSINPKWPPPLCQRPESCEDPALSGPLFFTEEAHHSLRATIIVPHAHTPHPWTFHDRELARLLAN
eukprot:scaffold191082_cov36-Tisochrysis_lutea.AAC.2